MVFIGLFVIQDFIVFTGGFHLHDIIYYLLMIFIIYLPYLSLLTKKFIHNPLFIIHVFYHMVLYLLLLL